MNAPWKTIPLCLFFALSLSCSPGQSKPTPRYVSVERLPKALVSLHPSHGGALVVDKSRAMMDVYGFESGKLKKIKSMKIASGKSHGNKLVQGDNRTPEGIYYFNRFREESTLLPKYGSGAFVTDYPNRFDRINRKTGGGIWLHGTNQEYRVDERFDSEGCVVVENVDLDDLAKYIRINRTPMIVYNEIPTVTADQHEPVRKELLAFLESWRSSWESKRLEDYMNHYSKKMFRSRSHNWTSWRNYKKSLNNVYLKIGVGVKEPRVYHYHPYAYIDFVQTYESRNINDTGDKRLGLYYEKGQWKIVSETFFKAQKNRDVSGATPVGNQATTL